MDPAYKSSDDDKKAAPFDVPPKSSEPSTSPDNSSVPGNGPPMDAKENSGQGNMKIQKPRLEPEGNHDKELDLFLPYVETSFNKIDFSKAHCKKSYDIIPVLNSLEFNRNNETTIGRSICSLTAKFNNGRSQLKSTKAANANADFTNEEIIKAAIDGSVSSLADMIIGMAGGKSDIP